MERHAIALAIALAVLQIGVIIRFVMEDRGAAIAAGEDMIEPAGDVEAWLVGHRGERTVRELLSHYACPTPIRVPPSRSRVPSCETTQNRQEGSARRAERPG